MRLSLIEIFLTMYKKDILRSFRICTPYNDFEILVTYYTVDEQRSVYATFISIISSFHSLLNQRFPKPAGSDKWYGSAKIQYMLRYFFKRICWRLFITQNHQIYVFITLIKLYIEAYSSTNDFQTIFLNENKKHFYSIYCILEQILCTLHVQYYRNSLLITSITKMVLTLTVQCTRKWTFFLRVF
jgi:hypothetical protein